MSVIFFLMSISSMSHVDLKKCPCRPVKFKGQVPLCVLENNKTPGEIRLDLFF